MEETNFITTWLSGQSWFSTAAQVMAVATMITMWVSDKWVDKYPWLKPVNAAMNFLSGNIFRNKNKK